MARMQSMSPEQTSAWCNSLASCGVRGNLLEGLQGAIVSQHVDGKKFSDMLKTNALQDLGIQELNPRLSVGIRRAWNTDFADTTFIPYFNTGLAPSNPGFDRFQSGQRHAEQQPRAGTPSGRRGAELGDKFQAPRPPMPFAADGSAQKLATAGAERAEDREAWLARRRAASLSRVGQAIGTGSPRQCSDSTSGARALSSDGAGRSSGSRPHSGGRPPSGGLGGLLPPRATAPNSFAAPAAHRGQMRSVRSAPSEVGAGSLEDAFASRQPAPTSFTPDAASAQRAQGSLPDDWGGGIDTVASCHDVAPIENVDATRYDPVSLARGQRRQGRGTAPGGDDAWSGVSLGDALGPKRAAKNRYGAPEDSEERCNAGAQQSANRGGGGDWEGGSLGDVLGKAPAVKHTYGSGEETDSHAACRQPAIRGGVGEWEGGSLGDVLGKAPAVKHTYGSAEGSEPQSQEALPSRRANDGDWGGSLADALKPGRQTSPSAQPPPSPQMQVPLKRREPPEADCWAGVSLGDAMGSPARAAPAAKPPEPRPGRRGGGGKTGAAPQGTEKSSVEIVAWLRTLPESHVPEAAREELVQIVEASGHDGHSFTDYVQKVPPEVCGPKPAMKLKAAWKNVLAEDDAKKIARENASAPVQKAVAMVC